MLKAFIWGQSLEATQNMFQQWSSCTWMLTSSMAYGHMASVQKSSTCSSLWMSAIRPHIAEKLNMTHLESREAHWLQACSLLVLQDQWASKESTKIVHSQLARLENRVWLQPVHVLYYSLFSNTYVSKAMFLQISTNSRLEHLPDEYNQKTKPVFW